MVFLKDILKIIFSEKAVDDKTQLAKIYFI